MLRKHLHENETVRLNASDTRLLAKSHRNPMQRFKAHMTLLGKIQVHRQIVFPVLDLITMIEWRSY